MREKQATLWSKLRIHTKNAILYQLVFPNFLNPWLKYDTHKHTHNVNFPQWVTQRGHLCAQAVMVTSFPSTSPKVIATLASADVNQFCWFFNFIEMDPYNMYSLVSDFSPTSILVRCIHAAAVHLHSCTHLLVTMNFVYLIWCWRILLSAPTFATAFWTLQSMVLVDSAQQWGYGLQRSCVYNYSEQRQAFPPKWMARAIHSPLGGMKVPVNHVFDNSKYCYFQMLEGILPIGARITLTESPLCMSMGRSAPLGILFPVISETLQRTLICL